MYSNFNYGLHHTTPLSPVKLNLQDLLDFKGISSKIFNFIVGYSNNYIDVYISNETIAEQIGCDKRHVIRVTNKLVEIGALIKVKRWDGKIQLTNLLKLNPIFYLAEIRDKLAAFFSNFKKWGMASLMRANKIFKKNVTLLNMYLFRKDSLSNNRREYSALDDIEFLSKRENKVLIQENNPPTSHNKPKRAINSLQEKNKTQYPLGDTVYCDSNVSINTNVLFPDHEKIAARAEKEAVLRRRMEESKKIIAKYDSMPTRFRPSSEQLARLKKSDTIPSRE